MSENKVDQSDPTDQSKRNSYETILRLPLIALSCQPNKEMKIPLYLIILGSILFASISVLADGKPSLTYHFIKD